MKAKKLTAAITAILMSVSLSACTQNSDSSSNSTSDEGTSSAADSNEAADDGEEKVIVLSESWDFSAGMAPSLNPGNASTQGGVYWGRNFYDTLVRYDDNGDIVGQLAEDWEISDDGKTYTFYLRDDIKFSDGTAFTSEAVKVSFEAAVYNLGTYNGSYGMLSALFDTIETPDEHTVVINLTQPYYAALNDLTMSCPLAIVNPAAFEGEADLSYGEAFKTSTFGTGAYMYEGDYSDNTYTFVKNPYYWGEEPEVDSFQVKVIQDNDAKLLALQSGEIDAIVSSSQISFDGYSEHMNNPDFETVVNERASLTRYLGMNVTTEPFNDIKVRQAVAYAIDQSVFETAVFSGLESAAETLFSKEKPYCDVEQTTYSTDIEKAKELMEEAGWVDTDGDGIREKDGTEFEVELNYLSSLASIDNAALAVSEQLLEIGIKANVISGDMMTYYSVMATSPLLLAYSYGGAFDPSTVVTNMNPTYSADPLSMQYSAYFEEGILDELNSTADEDRVEEIYAEILGTISEESLVVPLTYSHELGIWNNEKVEDYEFYADPNYIVVSGFDMK